MSDPTPFSMAEGAVAVHELYISYQKAGFSEAQAFELVKTALTGGAK